MNMVIYGKSAESENIKLRKEIIPKIWCKSSWKSEYAARLCQHIVRQKVYEYYRYAS